VAGITLDLQTMVRGYFEALGLDPQTGRPHPETARELGLEEALGRLSSPGGP